jgi:sulfur-oxidizing protein SoxY
VRGADGTHIRVAFRHPMDTGFVANIPTYNLDTLTLSGAGKAYGTMRIEASVAEDPTISIIAETAAGETVAVRASDTNGIRYDGSLAVREATPALAAVR